MQNSIHLHYLTQYHRRFLQIKQKRLKKIVPWCKTYVVQLWTVKDFYSNERLMMIEFPNLLFVKNVDLRENISPPHESANQSNLYSNVVLEVFVSMVVEQNSSDLIHFHHYSFHARISLVKDQFLSHVDYDLHSSMINERWLLLYVRDEFHVEQLREGYLLLRNWRDLLTKNH